MSMHKTDRRGEGGAKIVYLEITFLLLIIFYAHLNYFFAHLNYFFYIVQEFNKSNEQKIVQMRT